MNPNSIRRDMTPPHAGTDEETRRGLVRRLYAMSSRRKPYEGHWAELARYTQPRLGKNLNGATRQNAEGSEVNSKLMNDQGIWASEVLANGMATGLTSSSSPWFRITTADPDLRKHQEVKEWLAVVEDRLYGFFARTNYYTSMKTGHLELGVFGTSATVMVEHPLSLAVNWNMTAGDYWIGLDDGGTASTLFRRCDMTCVQLIERFGLDKVSSRCKQFYGQSRYETVLPVFHAIEPNTKRLPDTYDNANMAFRSVYWEMPGNVDTYNNAAGYGYENAAAYSSVGNDAPILEYTGYDERPFWAPRWDVVGSEVYGRSPAMQALPTLRSLQIKEIRNQQASDYMIRPSLRGPTALNNVHANLIPGGITTMATPDKAEFGPIWQVDPVAVKLLDEQVQRLEKKVDRAFHADLFLAVTNMPGVQPRNVEEIARRNEEALKQLGPAVDRNHNEQMRVSLQRAYGIITRLGWLPPMPEVLKGQPLRIEFTSILAQMMRAVGLQAIERFFAFVGTVAGEDPSVLDKVNRDEAINEYGDRVGVPPKIVVSDADVAKLRAARSQQQQAAQAASIAPAAKDGATAAKLLAQAQQISGGNGGASLGS